MASAPVPAPASPRSADDASAPLGWKAFSDRNFPGRPRHDYEAVAAYAAYRNAWAPGT